MKLAFQHTYQGSPDQVVALLRQAEFIEDVADHAGAVSHAARFVGDRTELDLELPTPSDVQSIIGKTVKLALSLEFQAPRSDGSVPGSVDVHVPGMPVEAKALGLLVPNGGDTRGAYEGELKVRIPLVGKKVEAKIEPFVVDAFRGIERRANVWLTR